MWEALVTKSTLVDIRYSAIVADRVVRVEESFIIKKYLAASGSNFLNRVHRALIIMSLPLYSSNDVRDGAVISYNIAGSVQTCSIAAGTNWSALWISISYNRSSRTFHEREGREVHCVPILPFSAFLHYTSSSTRLDSFSC